MTKTQIVKWIEQKEQDALLKIGQCEKEKYMDALFAQLKI